MSPNMSQGTITPEFLPNWDSLWTLRPQHETPVLNFNAPAQAHRRYMSFGAKPPRNPDSKSYMFAGDTRDAPAIPIPDIFNVLINKLHPSCNQVVVNWYEDGNDFTPMHRDCLNGLDTSTGVTIISLNHPAESKRALIMEHVSTKESKEYSQHNGAWINMNGKFLTDWRHGVPVDTEDLGQRISISLRTYRS